jgi:hypothetical protein
MATASTRGTGNDPLEGVDPGGTRPTKPGNPDKGGPAKPAEVSKEQDVVTGDQNDPASERAR